MGFVLIVAFVVAETTQLESRLKNTSVLSRNFIADAVEKAFPAVVNVAVDSGEQDWRALSILALSNCTLRYEYVV